MMVLHPTIRERQSISPVPSRSSSKLHMPMYADVRKITYGITFLPVGTMKEQLDQGNATLNGITEGGATMRQISGTLNDMDEVTKRVNPRKNPTPPTTSSPPHCCNFIFQLY